MSDSDATYDHNAEEDKGNEYEKNFPNFGTHKRKPSKKKKKGVKRTGLPKLPSTLA